MAEEVVRLGVDPQPAEEGYRRYRQATEAAIASTEQLDQSQRRNFITLAEFDRQAIDPYVRASRERVQADLQVRDMLHSQALAMNRAMSSTNATASASSSAVGGLSRLNYTLSSVARQALGVHPAMGQLANVIGTFSVGTLATAGVLGGLAAIATAVRLIGREAREAEGRLDDAREALDQLTPDPGAGPNVALLEARMAENRARFIQLSDPEFRRRQLGQVTEGGMTPAQIERERDEILLQMGEDARLIALGRRDVEEDEHSDRVDRARAMQEEIGFAMAEVDARIMGQILEDRRDAELNYQRRVSGEIREQAGLNLTAPPTIDVTSASFRKRAEEEQLRLTEEQARAAQELAELERARIRANIALVHSLRAVGQAYGGVTEQILGLISSALALDRMPMVSDTDKARGYLTAASMGVGYGHSTGNLGLGAIGGGVSGFAVAGPPGAIVGAVSGIVSGLIEQGRRAREAARIWRNSLRQFRLMFDDLTPLEQSREQNLQGFQQVSGGRTPAEVLEANRILRAMADAGLILESYANSLIQRNLDLIDAYRENERQAKNAAAANEELADSTRNLTSALNDPSGLRLSFYRWLGSGQFGGAGTDPGGPGGGLDWPIRPPIDDINDPTGGGGRTHPENPVYVENVQVTVSGADDPEIVAAKVMRSLRRDALLGGPNSLEVYAR